MSQLLLIITKIDDLGNPKRQAVTAQNGVRLMPTLTT